MNNAEISCHAELASRINYLKSEKLRQEEELKRTFKGLAYNFGPASMVMNFMNGREGQHKVLFNMVKGGLKMSFNFLIDWFLHRRRSSKGFLRSLLVEEFFILLVNSNVSKIMSLVNGFLFSNAGKRTNENSNK